MTDFVVVECAVRQLHARFQDAVWRKDADAFAACFAADGEWKIAGMTLRGRKEVGEGFARLLGFCERVQLILGAPLLEVGDGVATSRSHVTELARLMDGGSALTIGIYYDTYVEEAGSWRFQRRHWSMHYRGVAELPGPLAPSPDYGPPPGMPGPDEPTYVRPK